MDNDVTLDAQMTAIGKAARAAAWALRESTPEERTAAIAAIAAALRRAAADILLANAEDVARAGESVTEARLDRMRLSPARIEAIANGIDAIAALSDPIGAVIAEWTRPNGLVIQRVRVPIGVIGMIFESRPNVAADASALALRAGNVIVLRGGSESIRTVAVIGSVIHGALAETKLPQNAVQIVPSADRAAVGTMLTGMGGAIDVIIPRGGKSLVARVQEEACVPVLAHLEGLCHTYIHAHANPEKAVALAVNAKMRRVSVCGATETLLIDRAIAPALLPRIAASLRAAGCELRGNAEACDIVDMARATELDWSTEYLAPILSVRVLSGIDEAVAHIARYGSQHTDCIVTENAAAAEQFLRQVDSAIVLHNASTQFADGGEFGFGGEIGIATGRLHARGPVGAEQLTTFKYVVRGAGQIRP